MQISSLVFLAASAVAQVTVTPIASQNSTATPTVTVVKSFTTVCVEPTVITYSDVCYTATSSGQTLTITNCPCTIPMTEKWTEPTSTHYPSPTPTYVEVAGAKKQGVALGGVLAAGAALLAL